MQTALLIALIGGAVTVGIFQYTKHRKITSYLQGRTPLTDEDFAALFPSTLEGKVGVSIRRHLKSWVAFDVRLVRPQDLLCGDLLLDALDGMDPDVFLASVEKEWKVKLPDVNSQELRSIAELASAVSRYASEMQSNQSALSNTRGRLQPLDR